MYAPSMHKTSISFAAGVHTYKVTCEECGLLRGISLTRRDAETKAADHRREKEAS